MQAAGALATWALVRRALVLGLLLSAACRAPGAPSPPPSEVSGPFVWTAGEWRGTRTDAERGEAAPIVVRVRPVLGGAGRIEELEVVHSRGVYRGVQLLLHEAEAERWVNHYANVDGRLVPLEGRAQGESFVWQSVAPARTRESRLVYERPGNQHWRRRQEVSQDGGASWQVLFVDELERAER